jgi:hypothetical protein
VAETKDSGPMLQGRLKRIPDADDQAAQLARMERLCTALDDVRAEADRLYSEITAKARRARAAVVTGEVARGLVVRTFARGVHRRQRLARDRAD